MRLPDTIWSVVYVVGFVVYAWIRHSFEARARGQTKLVRHVDATEKSLLAVVALGTFLLPMLHVFTTLLSFADFPPPPGAQWAGVAVMLAALWLFRRSHADLGVNWSVTLEIREGHELVTGGVYRRVRHPMYAAIWLWGVAQALLLPNWIAGPAALVTWAPLYFVRTPREERMMRERFGAAWDEYVRRTGRLLPG